MKLCQHALQTIPVMSFLDAEMHFFKCKFRIHKLFFNHLAWFWRCHGRTESTDLKISFFVKSCRECTAYAGSAHREQKNVMWIYLQTKIKIKNISLPPPPETWPDFTCTKTSTAAALNLGGFVPQTHPNEAEGNDTPKHSQKKL